MWGFEPPFIRYHYANEDALARLAAREMEAAAALAQAQGRYLAPLFEEIEPEWDLLAYP